MSFQFLKTRVEILHPAHPMPSADALLLPTNDLLWLADGPALEIKRREGEWIEQEAVRLGPARLGAVVESGAGGLPVGRVLHCVVMGQDLQVKTDAAVAALREGIATATSRRWETLLVHSFLSTGRGTSRDLAGPLLGCLVDALLEGVPLRAITLLAATEEERKVLHDGLLRVIQQHP